MRWWSMHHNAVAHRGHLLRLSAAGSSTGMTQPLAGDGYVYRFAEESLIISQLHGDLDIGGASFPLPIEPSKIGPGARVVYDTLSRERGAKCHIAVWVHLRLRKLLKDPFWRVGFYTLPKHRL